MIQKFFLNSNSAKGFYSFYNELESKDFNKAYMILGSPGSGKSTLMKKINRRVGDGDTEEIYCSSDFNSLDALICRQSNFIFADSTFPHCLNAKYPVIKDEIISLYKFSDKKKILSAKEELIRLCDEKTNMYGRIYRHLEVLGKIDAGIKALTDVNADAEKARRTAKNYCLKLITKNSASDFKTENRFLTSITYNGIFDFFGTVCENYNDIYVYEDYYEISDNFIKTVSETLDAFKISNIKCRCALNPDKIEHILIPELSAAFITSNKYHSYKGSYYRKINARRFVDFSNIAARKNLIKFYKKSKQLYLEKIYDLMNQAKDIHFKIEELYKASMDFGRMNKEIKIE